MLEIRPRLEFPAIWEKIRDISLTEDVTTATLDNLDLDRDKAYMLVVSIHNPTTLAPYYYLFFNEDTTLTNYYTQIIYAAATALSASRTNNPYFALASAGQDVFAFVKIIRTPDGYPRWQSNIQYNNPPSINIIHYYGARNVVENVTRIDITSSEANGIGAGSRIMLFRVAR